MFSKKGGRANTCHSGIGPPGDFQVSEIVVGRGGGGIFIA